MSRLLARLIPISALLPTAVLAHPGVHEPNKFVANLRHIFSEPDHLAMLAAAAIVVGVVIYRRKGHQQ